jgi:hypothetical protein
MRILAHVSSEVAAFLRDSLHSDWELFEAPSQGEFLGVCRQRRHDVVVLESAGESLWLSDETPAPRLVQSVQANAPAVVILTRSDTRAEIKRILTLRVFFSFEPVVWRRESAKADLLEAILAAASSSFTARAIAAVLETEEKLLVRISLKSFTRFA